MLVPREVMERPGFSGVSGSTLFPTFPVIIKRGTLSGLLRNTCGLDSLLSVLGNGREGSNMKWCRVRRTLGAALLAFEYGGSCWELLPEVTLGLCGS